MYNIHCIHLIHIYEENYIESSAICTYYIIIYWIYTMSINMKIKHAIIFSFIVIYIIQ